MTCLRSIAILALLAALAGCDSDSRPLGSSLTRDGAHRPSGSVAIDDMQGSSDVSVSDMHRGGDAPSVESTAR